MALNPIRFSTNKELLQFVDIIKQNPSIEIILADDRNFYYADEFVQAYETCTLKELNRNPSLQILALNVPQGFFALESAPKLDTVEAVQSAQTQLDTTSLMHYFSAVNVYRNFISINIVNPETTTLIEFKNLHSLIHGLNATLIFEDLSKLYLRNNLLLGSYILKAIDDASEKEHALQHQLGGWIKSLDDEIHAVISVRKMELKNLEMVKKYLSRFTEGYNKRLALDPDFTNLAGEIEALTQQRSQLVQKVNTKRERYNSWKAPVFWSIFYAIPLVLTALTVGLSIAFAPVIVCAIVMIICPVAWFAPSFTAAFFPNVFEGRPTQYFNQFRDKIYSYFENDLQKDTDALDNIINQFDELTQLSLYVSNLEQYKTAETILDANIKDMSDKVQELENIVLYRTVDAVSIQNQSEHTVAKVSTLGLFSVKTENVYSADEPPDLIVGSAPK